MATGPNKSSMTIHLSSMSPFIAMTTGHFFLALGDLRRYIINDSGTRPRPCMVVMIVVPGLGLAWW